MDVGLDKKEKLIKKLKRFSLLLISRNSMNVCIKVCYSGYSFLKIFYPYFLIFVYLFILGGGIFLDDLFRGLPRGTK